MTARNNAHADNRDVAPTDSERLARLEGRQEEHQQILVQIQQQLQELTLEIRNNRLSPVRHAAPLHFSPTPFTHFTPVPNTKHVSSATPFLRNTPAAPLTRAPVSHQLHPIQQPHSNDTPPKHPAPPAAEKHPTHPLVESNNLNVKTSAPRAAPAKPAPLSTPIPLHAITHSAESTKDVAHEASIEKDIVCIMICPQPETQHKPQQHTLCLSSRDSFLTEVQTGRTIYALVINPPVILNAEISEAIPPEPPPMHLDFYLELVYVIIPQAKQSSPHNFAAEEMAKATEIPPEPPPNPMNNSRTSFLEDGVNDAVNAGNNGKLGKGCSQAWKDEESMAAQIQERLHKSNTWFSIFSFLFIL